MTRRAMFLMICATLGSYASGAGRAPGVTASFDAARPVSSRERLEFKLEQGAVPTRSRIAVLIGTTDITSLIETTGDSLVYVPRILPLPEGDSWVHLYTIGPRDSWSEVARFVLRVARTPGPSQQGKTAPQRSTSTPAPHRTWVFDKAAITPSFTVGVKSQPAESHFPASNAPLRPTFADLTMQGSVVSDFLRGPFEVQTQFNVVGSSFQQEALRFFQDGKTAPEVDLTSYTIQLRMGKTRLNVGSISFGSNRELMNSFASRGFALNAPLSHGFDLSLAAMNGTNIVGWNNFFGLERADHHIIAGTLGLEVLQKRPGGMRLEATVMDGEVLPISSFNQGTVTDAQRNRGFGFHLLSSSKDQRWRIDAGFARSNFTNPSDPLLNQGAAVVPVRPVTRDAHFIDASYMLLRNLSVGKTKKANLTASVHHERVAPLFRSVAAFTQADRLQNQIDVVGQFGDITATVSHLRSNDNLADIPSILRSLTRRTNFIVAAPLTTLFTDAAHPRSWLPRISYSFDQTDQFGARIPVNGGFELNLSAIPNQVSTNQTFTTDWQWKTVRFGYRFNRSFQDNRQIGRENADFENVIDGLSLGIAATKSLDVSFDLGAESAFNRETLRTDSTLRLGGNLNWRISRKMSLQANASTTGAGALAGLVRNRTTLVNAQWSYQWLSEKTGLRKIRGQFFFRYADQYAFRFDSAFRIDSLLKLQTLNAGLSFTFF